MLSGNIFGFQKITGFMESRNTNGLCFGKKKFNLSNKGKAVFAKNLMSSQPAITCSKLTLSR